MSGQKEFTSLLMKFIREEEIMSSYIEFLVEEI